MGRVSAALATSDAIRRWKPQYVILVGIAGGIQSRGVQLGDLLISDQVVDYETEKITDDGKPDVRWRVQLADPRLLGAAKNIPLSQCLPKLSANRPVSGEPNRLVGSIATGDKIVATSDLLEQHGQVWTKLIGVEMEAGGVAAAAFESSQKPGFFMVRAVSDHADADKNAPSVVSWRSYACDLAATFTMALLENAPVPMT
jgi:nucleoside phosphorylase